MRRGAGIGAIKKKTLEQAKYKDKGYELAADEFEQMTKQLDIFRIHLEEFAGKHKSDIKKNAEFRRQFQEMCSAIGVDPLASSKGFWSTALGFGDYYYELGVQIVEVCLSLRDQTGGLMMMEELRTRLIASRSQTRREDVSVDDITRAVTTLKVLGSGFSLIPLKQGLMVQSIPAELNVDHTAVIQLAQTTSHITLSHITSELDWENERANKVLEELVKEGLVWIDHTGGKREVGYWFPSLFITSSDNS